MVSLCFSFFFLNKTSWNETPHDKSFFALFLVARSELESHRGILNVGEQPAVVVLMFEGRMASVQGNENKMESVKRSVKM